MCLLYLLSIGSFAGCFYVLVFCCLLGFFDFVLWLFCLFVGFLFICALFVGLFVVLSWVWFLLLRLRCFNSLL